MSWVSIVCFAGCAAIVLTMIRRGADPVSPSRVFGFVWCLALGLTDLKLSSLQAEWTLESWLLLLTGIFSFLLGTFCAYVINLSTPLLPVSQMRPILSSVRFREGLLFRLIWMSVAVYAISYLVIYLVKGFLPIFVIGTKISRVDFYVFGFGVLINSTAFIIFFTMVYVVFVRNMRKQKIILVTLTVLSLGSYILLLQRFQLIMATVICATLLYYATNRIRVKTVLPVFLTFVAIFYGISTLRLGNALATLNYHMSRMKFPVKYAMVTEPYMYMVMNLENFARSAELIQRHTFGYFTFDFVTAITGLKYWLIDYFGIERNPFLISGYNTYTAFWWFYSDFGVFGLAMIPMILGFGTGWLYYRMRSEPTIQRVTAYGVMIFIMIISFFSFPAAMLWFEYNMLALYFFLRWTIIAEPTKTESLAG